MWPSVYFILLFYFLDDFADPTPPPSKRQKKAEKTEKTRDNRKMSKASSSDRTAARQHRFRPSVVTFYFVWNTHGWIVLISFSFLFCVAIICSLTEDHLLWESDWCLFWSIIFIHTSDGRVHTSSTLGTILFWQRVPYVFDKGTKHHTFLTRVPYFFDKGIILFWQRHHTFLTRVPSTILFWQEYHTFWQGHHPFLTRVPKMLPSFDLQCDSWKPLSVGDEWSEGETD